VNGKRILLIIGGGIAAYKCLELIRRLREQGCSVRAIMTKAACQFITPLSVGALTNQRVFIDLFDLDGEHEIGHIRLSRDADLVVVAPATADLMAKMAGGHADDLASTALMATDKPVLIAPAMNPRMWLHPATRRNAALLASDGIAMVGPNSGEMAERGEAGPGRMAEPAEILAAITRHFGAGETSPSDKGALSGKHVLVTTGPTYEPIDPVRYIANRSSGKQGDAIARAAAGAGARVTLVSGPTRLPDPAGMKVVRVETARQMLAAVEANLPADIAIFAAAVADWRVAHEAGDKIKKGAAKTVPQLDLVENPDILRAISRLPQRAVTSPKSSGPARPGLVVGFAAETQDVLANATKKRRSKGCDWIVANDVSPAGGVFGGDRNTVHLVTAAGHESWPEMAKDDVASALVGRIIAHVEAQVDAVRGGGTQALSRL
jgi:phosphopantothenoylcysteine decarboxylase / phosphopantothenate---cysteine ligase